MIMYVNNSLAPSVVLIISPTISHLIYTLNTKLHSDGTGPKAETGRKRSHTPPLRLSCDGIESTNEQLPFHDFSRASASATRYSINNSTARDWGLALSASQFISLIGRKKERPGIGRLETGTGVF
jgi:hypothetical protein